MPLPPSSLIAVHLCHGRCRQRAAITLCAQLRPLHAHGPLVCVLSRLLACLLVSLCSVTKLGSVRGCGCLHTHTHTHTHTHRVLRAAAVFRLRNRRDELIAAVSLPKLAFRVGESVDVSLFFDQSQVTVASVRWRDVGWRERTRCNHVCMCVCVSVRVSVNLFA